MSLRGWVLAAVLGVTLHHGDARAAEPVDLNTAPESTLQTLPGIGPKKAAAIVALRAKRPFSRVSQLLEVRGIGKKTLERLKAHVRVGVSPATLGAPAGAAAAAVEAGSAGAGAPGAAALPAHGAASARAATGSTGASAHGPG